MADVISGIKIPEDPEAGRIALDEWLRRSQEEPDPASANRRIESP